MYFWKFYARATRQGHSSDGACDPQKSTDLTDNIIVKRSPTGHYQKSILLHLNPRKIVITTSNCKVFESCNFPLLIISFTADKS